MAKGDTKIYQCQFINNYAAYGGAVWIGQPQAQTDFISSNATNNHALYSGGVLYLT